MRRGLDFARKESERRARRRIFHIGFFVLVTLSSGWLLWQARALLLPIMVGALLAFLFRPVKERFNVPWLPHELQVLCSFALIGLAVFVTASNVVSHIPGDKQKLELKVRIKYKLNEKYQQLAKPRDGKETLVSALIAKEGGPIMDKMNHWLDLSTDEHDLFLKYRAGFDGESIEDRFFDYFQANQTTSTYASSDSDPVAAEKVGAPSATAGLTPGSVSVKKNKLADELAVWMLAPIIFIFLGFDNGQMRRYFIGLIPNKFFELSLTVMDGLDEAIGNYLRGTLMECFLVGLTLTVGFIFLGIPISVAIAIGVISGLVNAIPFLGTVIGLVIGLGYALIAENVVPVIPGLNPEDLPIYVVALVALAHILDNVVFQPFVLGSAVSIHPIVVVIAIMTGSLLMGLWGMLFAIPTVVVLKTAIETLFKGLKDYRII